MGPEQIPISSTVPTSWRMNPPGQVSSDGS